MRAQKETRRTKEFGKPAGLNGSFYDRTVAVEIKQRLHHIFIHLVSPYAGTNLYGSDCLYTGFKLPSAS